MTLWQESTVSALIPYVLKLEDTSIANIVNYIEDIYDGISDEEMLATGIEIYKRLLSIGVNYDNL